MPLRYHRLFVNAERGAEERLLVACQPHEFDVAYPDGIGVAGEDALLTYHVGVAGVDAVLQGHDFIPVLPCAPLAAYQQTVHRFGVETARIVRFDVGFEVKIYVLQVLRVFVPAEEGGYLVDESHHGGESLHVVRACSEVYAYDDVGSHVAGDVYRKIIVYTAVHQHHTVAYDRCERPRNGHARPDGQRQVAVAVDLLLAFHHVVGHACEGDGQRIEIEVVVVIAERHLVEQVEDALSGQHAGGYGELLVQRERDGEDVHVGYLLLREQFVASGYLVAQQCHPILVPDQRIELLRGPAYRIEAADDGTHACPRDVVDGDSRLFQHFDDADVRDAFGPSSAEYEAYFPALLFFAGGGLV